MSGVSVQQSVAYGNTYCLIIFIMDTFLKLFASCKEGFPSSPLCLRPEFIRSERHCGRDAPLEMIAHHYEGRRWRCLGVNVGVGQQRQTARLIPW